jgi:hypothetical protein
MSYQDLFMSNFKVTRLICPSCQDDLYGLKSDNVFTCRSCQTAFDVAGGSMEAFFINFASFKNSGIKGNIIYLPVWKLSVETDVTESAGISNIKKSMAEEMRGSGPAEWFLKWSPKTVWVCGFFENRPAYLGNPGLDLTEQQSDPVLSPGPPEEAVVVGIARTKNQAYRYARIFVTAILDRHKDVTGIKIDVKVTGTELWAFPFLFNAQNGNLINLTNDMVYSAAILDSLPEIIEYSNCIKK